jgi:hypothetical protein
MEQIRRLCASRSGQSVQRDNGGFGGKLLQELRANRPRIFRIGRMYTTIGLKNSAVLILKIRSIRGPFA